MTNGAQGHTPIAVGRPPLILGPVRDPSCTVEIIPGLVSSSSSVSRRRSGYGRRPFRAIDVAAGLRTWGAYPPGVGHELASFIVLDLCQAHQDYWGAGES